MIIVHLQAMHPVPNLMRGVALAAPAVDSSIYQPGQMTISLTGADPVPGRNVSRLHLLMQLPWPAWGVLNVTGPLQGWSYADTIEVRHCRLFPNAQLVNTAASDLTCML